MIGTDFHPGIRGIGPKTGLKLIREHGTLEAVAEAKEFELPERLEEIRSLFLEHPTTPDALPRSTHAVEEDLWAFLQDERGFSERRVQRALDRLTGVARLRSSSQPTLFDF
jgi:flap endonuclease-1